MWNIVWVSPRGHRSVSGVCKSPFPSAGTAVSVFRAKAVQHNDRLLALFYDTWLPGDNTLPKLRVTVKWANPSVWLFMAGRSRHIVLKVSVCLFVTKLVNTIFWKRMNWFRCKLTQVGRAWNDQLWRSGEVKDRGQSSRSHEAIDRFGGQVEVFFFSTLLVQVVFLVDLYVGRSPAIFILSSKWASSRSCLALMPFNGLNAYPLNNIRLHKGNSENSFTLE